MADRARVKDLYGFGAVSPATEDSVRRARSQRPEPLGDRLLLTESIFAALFVVAAIALIEIGNPGHVPVGPAIVLTIAFALLSRFEFEVVAGYAIPTQLAFVPTWTLDVLLSPIGLLGALASEQRQYAFVLVFPLALLMWVFAQERHARLDQQIETSRTYRRTALLLGELIGEDDEYTGAHSQGVVSLAVAIADELGLGEDQRRLVEFGALLHDVGKIGVPKEIVNKTAALSDDEWEVMRRHTITGQRMLDRVGGALKDVGEIVRASHERWDGTGYPDGLTGEEIPIAARIVCAADAFSAMTTDRPYRAARDREFAIAELRAQSGRQFDPQVAEATIAMVERYGLPRNRRVIELEAPGLQAPA